jgi:hypothetical protein
MNSFSNQPTMITDKELNIDEETIESLGLQLTDTPLTAEAVNPWARVFTVPGLEEVYIMESDLYGKQMPKDSVFLAFNGPHGLIGKPMKIEKLRRLSVKDIKKIVEDNNPG